MSITHICKDGTSRLQVEWRYDQTIEDGQWMLWTGEIFMDINYCPYCGEKLQPPQRLNT